MGSFRRVGRVLVAVLVLVVVIGGWAAYRIGLGRPFTKAQLEQRVALDIFRDDPDMFTRGGIGDGSWWDIWSPRFTDDSPARASALAARKRRLLAHLYSYAPSANGTSAGRSDETIAWFL
ncbi:MAG: hypothetical protein LUQ59_11935, partial [Methanothrix sp.]|nr:hypothetical protein [Methanothrix sp.]